MSAPVRIQRKRTKGWKWPEGVVYVGRPTVFGNPFKVEDHGRSKSLALFREMLDDENQRRVIGYPSDRTIRESLKGKSLMCWCHMGAPCHADVLLEIANAE